MVLFGVIGSYANGRLLVSRQVYHYAVSNHVIGIMQSFSLQQHGVSIRRGLTTRQQLQAVIDELATAGTTIPKHGIRNAEKKLASIQAIVHSDKVLVHARKILNANPQVVRVIFFDKTPEKNWLVTWHQDKTVSLNSKLQLAGWGPWSIKDGTHHVHPPLDVLEQMVTFRIHLDPADEQNGCLKVIPGSHRLGILSQAQITDITKRKKAVFCTVAAGDAVIMRPLVLHASSKATLPSHRRVVHIEFAGYELPDDVKWG